MSHMLLFLFVISALNFSRQITILSDVSEGFFVFFMHHLTFHFLVFINVSSVYGAKMIT